jgi:hypothetical protein
MCQAKSGTKEDNFFFCDNDLVKQGKGGENLNQGRCQIKKQISLLGGNPENLH